MNSRRKGKKRGRTAVLLLLMTLLAGLLLLRGLRNAGTGEAPAPTSTPPGRPETPASAPPTPAPSPSAAPTATPAPEPAESVEEKPGSEELPAPAVLGYDAHSYEIVSDMIYTYRHLGDKGADTVQTRLTELKEANPALGAMWEKVMEVWSYARNQLEIRIGMVPEGLPEDDSLGIVVLGFQLLPDGGMERELIARCQLALDCAAAYPEAYVIVTGGGTARGNREMTEAAAMADWFRKNGLPAERLIEEDQALTTGQNAQNICAILTADYPQVKELLLVTSDYHMRMSWLLFSAEAYLYEYENGAIPYRLAANTACDIPSLEDYESSAIQAQYLWTLMDPHY